MLLCDGTMEALDNFGVLRNVCLGQGARYDFCGRKSVRSESSRVAEFPLIGGESSTLDQAAQTTRGVPSSEPPWLPGAGVPNLCVTCFFQRHSWSSGRLLPCSSWSLSMCVRQLMVPPGSWSPSPLYPNLPCTPTSLCWLAPEPALAPCLTSRDENKLQ